LDEIDIPQIKIKQLYIKLNEKIDISAKEVIFKNNNNNSKEINFQEIEKYIKKLSTSTKWLNSISIEKINAKGVDASLRYESSSIGFIDIKTKDYTLYSKINLEKDIVHFKITSFYNKNKTLNSSGDIYLDTKNIKLYSNINLKIKNNATFNLYIKSDTNKIFYKIKSLKKIKNIKNIIKLFTLPKEVKFWIDDAIAMNYLDIKSFNGYVDYKNPTEAIKNIYVKAIIDKLNYTYNINLDSIHTKETILEFKKGVLYIRPQDSYSYNMPLQKSWLKIDFLQKEELLTLHLLFDGQINSDILKILSTYKINLPFKQKSGYAKTNLTLKVGLRSIDIDAKGSFYVKKGLFYLYGLDIDISNANILLDNYKASIKSMKASYEDIAKADVDFKYDASTGKGLIDFFTNDIHYKNIHLLEQEQPLHISYKIMPKQDSINIEKSKWILEDKIFNLNKLSIPFNIENPLLKIPATLLIVDNIANGLISGDVDIKKQILDMKIDLLNFEYDGIKLSGSNTVFDLKYDKELSLSSKSKIFFSISGSKYIANNFYLKYLDENIYIKHTDIKIGDFINTKVYATYNIKTQKSHISLSKFIVKKPGTDTIVYKNNKLLLSLSFLKNKIEILSKELNAKFNSQDGQWTLSLKSLGRIANNLKILKKYKLTNGDIIFTKKENENFTNFISNIDYPYALIEQNNKLIKKYHVNGKIYKTRFFAKINNNITINSKNKININIKNCGINIDELQKAIKSINDNQNDKTSDININVVAKDSYLYISDRRKVISDTIRVQYYNNILTAQLKYKNGYSGLKIENNDLNLYGKNFNYEFMNKLFSLAKFKNGTLDFSIKGTLENYNGIFFISNTIITDYKILNNILAFVNTVPSLMTFNIPGYNKHGLFVEKAYMKLNSKNNNLAISDIYLHSKELDIVGKGNANINKNTIDLALNLKTDLGSNLSKIPIVGYILLDRDTISTTLNITGKLNNPTVTSMAAKEIIVAPFNIIKRTLTLPYKLLKSSTEK